MSAGSVIVRRTIGPSPEYSNRLRYVSCLRRCALMTQLMARTSHCPGASQLTIISLE